MSIRTRLTLLAFPLLLAGCAGGRMPSNGGGPFAAADDGPQTISIHVQNLNFNDAALWAISRSGRERLGIVGGKSDAVYRIAWNMPQPLQIEIDLLAGERCTTEPISTDPGDSLDLQIQMDLSMQRGCRY